MVIGWLALIIRPLQIKKFNMPNVAFEGAEANIFYKHLSLWVNSLSCFT